MVIGIIIGIVLLLMAALWIVLRTAYRNIFYHDPGRPFDLHRLPAGDQYRPYDAAVHALLRESEGIDMEEISITADDGIRLAAQYLPGVQDAPLIIMCHGYKGAALRDFAGGFRIARECGYASLLIDERAHGKSEGYTITFGVKERYDILRWAEYAEKRFGSEIPIVLCGVSMGAASVLMASDLPLPENVKGIIADCGYSSPKKIICKNAAEWGYPIRLLWPVIRLSAKWFGHFDVCEAAAEDSVKRAKVPILLIHGEDDRFVPCYMSKEVAAACASPVEEAYFPNAPHAYSYLEDTDRYEKLIQSFVERRTEHEYSCN